MKVSPDLFDSNSGFFSDYQNRFQKAYQQLQTDLEEAKGHEILKLHNSLQAIQLKVEETHALLTNERESAQNDLEEAKEEEILKLKLSLQATHGKVDEINALRASEQKIAQKKIDKLSREVEELKSLLESERNRANESEKKWLESLETSETKQHKSEEGPLNEKQQEYQDLLNRCIVQNLGFSEGRPVAACIIYKCVRQFAMEKTSIYDCIIQAIGQAIKIQDNNKEVLAYWLSNASILLVLFQRTLKQDEANCPSYFFKQQLTAYVEKIYGMICDNLKKEISPLLELCIQAPKLSTVNLPTRTDVSHWHEIVNKLDCFLDMLKSNNVAPFLVCKIFMKSFSFINRQLFNSLLLRGECCSFSNGEYVKAGLCELENWCYKATKKYANSAWDELKHTREAVGFLVIHQKQKMTLHELSRDLCPVLSIQQLYRISTIYWDDKYGTHSVSSDVFSKMRVHMEKNTYKWENNLFLLVDDLSIPFSVEDLSKSMDAINIDVEPPPFICDSSRFRFLMPQAE